MRIPTRDLVFMSLFIAINIILSRLASIHLSFGGVEYTRIGFGAFPILFGSLLLGPKYGMIIGVLGDVIGYHLNPVGPYMPHFTFIAALKGIIPGLLFRLLNEKADLWRFVLCIAVTKLICSVLLTPYVFWTLFKIPLIVTVPQRLIAMLVTIPIFAYCSQILYTRLFLTSGYRSGLPPSAP